MGGEGVADRPRAFVPSGTLEDQIAVDHAVEPVGAMNYGVAFLGLDSGQSGSWVIPGPERLGDDVTLRMGGRPGLCDLADANELGNQAVVFGEPVQQAVAKKDRRGCLRRGRSGSPIPTLPR